MKSNFSWRRHGCIVWPMLAFLAVTCQAQNKFSVDTSATTTITVAEPTATLAFAAFAPLNLATNSTLTTQGIQLDDLASVKLLDLTLLVQSPASGQDLTFVSNVTFYIQAAGKPRLPIATRATFDPNNNFQSLQVQDVELADYFKQGDVTINAAATVQAPPGSVIVEAQPTFQVLVTANQPACN